MNDRRGYTKHGDKRDTIRELAKTMNPTKIGKKFDPVMRGGEVERIGKLFGIEFPHKREPPPGKNLSTPGSSKYEHLIPEIRKLAPTTTCRSIAKQVGISETTVRRIVDLHKSKTGEETNFYIAPTINTGTEKLNKNLTIHAMNTSMLMKKWVKNSMGGRNAIRTFH